MITTEGTQYNVVTDKVQNEDTTDLITEGYFTDVTEEMIEATTPMTETYDDATDFTSPASMTELDETTVTMEGDSLHDGQTTMSTVTKPIESIFSSEMDKEYIAIVPEIDVSETHEYFASPVDHKEGTFRVGKAVAFDFSSAKDDEDLSPFVREIIWDGNVVETLEFGGLAGETLVESDDTFKYNSHSDVERPSTRKIGEITEVSIHDSDKEYTFAIGSNQAIQKAIDQVNAGEDFDPHSLVQIDVQRHHGAHFIAKSTEEKEEGQKEGRYLHHPKDIYSVKFDAKYGSQDQNNKHTADHEEFTHDHEDHDHDMYTHDHEDHDHDMYTHDHEDHAHDMHSHDHEEQSHDHEDTGEDFDDHDEPSADHEISSHDPEEGSSRAMGSGSESTFPSFKFMTSLMAVGGLTVLLFSF